MATPASYESKAPKTRRFPFGLPRRRWIGLATVVLIVASVFFYYCATPTVPRFPNATLCFITADGRELAQAGLQASPDPIIYSINSAKVETTSK
jgi:hypothetical protein